MERATCPLSILLMAANIHQFKNHPQQNSTIKPCVKHTSLKAIYSFQSFLIFNHYMQSQNAIAPPAPYRVASIDILRGIIMIIMALDHTRDFFHASALTADPLAPTTTTPALFFTRWITHFCAPTFVFLSGLSAYLSSQKKNAAEASLFLFKRGLWLIFVEVVIVSFGLTFDYKFGFIIWQVIWAIGCSMIILAAVRQLPTQVDPHHRMYTFLWSRFNELYPSPATGN